MAMQLLISNPQKELFSGEVKSVRLPGKRGSFAIFPMHAPLVSLLDAGQIICQTEVGTTTFLIKKGVVIVEKSRISVFISA